MNALIEDLTLIEAGQQPTVSPVIPVRSRRVFKTGMLLLALLAVPALVWFLPHSWFSEEVSKGRLQLPRIERKQHGLSLRAMAHTTIAMPAEHTRPGSNALRDRIKSTGGLGLTDEEILEVYNALCGNSEATDRRAETPALMLECINILEKRGRRTTITSAKISYADKLLETQQFLQAKTSYNDVLRDLSNLYQQSPINGLCHLGLARCAEADGRCGEALLLLDKALLHFLANKDFRQAAMVAYTERLFIHCTIGDTTDFQSDLKSLYSELVS